MAHYHFIGIGGTGLSAIALILCQQGQQVSGSDQQESSFTQRLRTAGATVYIGQRPEQVLGAACVIRSSAVPDSNPEVQAALAAGIPVQKRQDFLGEWMAQKIGVAVAGTHGKTTTTAMLALLLTQLQADPTFIVGGELPALGGNAAAGRGAHFIIEADEYDRMFLGLRPRYAVLTNLEFDHPDIYADYHDLQQTTQAFVRLLPSDGCLLACADDPGAAQVALWAKANGIRCYTYGVGGDTAPDWQALQCTPNADGGSDFVLAQQGVPITTVRLAVPGLHNVRNALAVLAVAAQLGFSPTLAARYMLHFTGVGRRFEIKAHLAGRVIIDDYAHHPTEIRATLAAARQRYPNRPLWVCFQPHTFSRTTALAAEFAACFALADMVLLTDIYAAREVAQPDSVLSPQLAQSIRHSSTPPAALQYLPTLADCTAFASTNLPSDAVFITLGAGNGYTVGEAVAKYLQTQAAA